MPARTISINLLPGDELDNAPFGKFLKWALTYGRYIVVITELIVLLAFLSRFKLDRDLADLSDSINRKKNMIAANSQFEDNIRSLQSRLTQISSIEKGTANWDGNFKLIAQALPSDAQINEVKVVGRNITLHGTVGSESGVSTILNNLQKDPKIRTVTVDQISKKSGSNYLVFSLSVDLWP